jgi:magnesium transporter
LSGVSTPPPTASAAAPNSLSARRCTAQVLEVCLDHVATTMSDKVRALEAESASALDRLAQRVTAGHLDHVRRVKNLMVRLNTRVETIRVLLEKYLGDDDDLAELHLTGRLCGPAPLVW